MKERINENHSWVTDDGFFLICGDEITDSASKGNMILPILVSLYVLSQQIFQVDQPKIYQESNET